jgi:DNA-binding NtrC family response regulator
MPHILIVEDEAAIADTLIFALQGDGFTTTWLSLGAPALEHQRQAGTAGERRGADVHAAQRQGLRRTLCAHLPHELKSSQAAIRGAAELLQGEMPLSQRLRAKHATGLRFRPAPARYRSIADSPGGQDQ